jgi:hypothetical protein
VLNRNLDAGSLAHSVLESGSPQSLANATMMISLQKNATARAPPAFRSAKALSRRNVMPRAGLMDMLGMGSKVGTPYFTAPTIPDTPHSTASATIYACRHCS